MSVKRSAVYLCFLSPSGESYADAQIFFYLYISCLIVSSCYTLIWDLKMDWGLFDRNAGENTFLREEIVYPHKVCLERDGGLCGVGVFCDPPPHLTGSLRVSAGLLLQRHSGGCAAAVLLDADAHAEHSGEGSWYGRHTGHCAGPHGGLQVPQPRPQPLSFCCVFCLGQSSSTLGLLSSRFGMDETRKVANDQIYPI